MLIIGFFLLIIGADLLVKGSGNIAKKFHIPEMLIGLTIVALGTSMPELVITISSANHNSTELIIGNTMGSNLCNLLLIMGLVAILRPINIDNETKVVHLPVAIISNIVILGMGLGILGSLKGTISKTDGIILVLFYFLYFLYPIATEVKDIINSIKDKNKKHKRNENILLPILFIILGVFFLKLGGDLVVEKSTQIAMKYGISESVIGLTIIAIGTALPEMITSIIAVIKNEESLAIGNLIGSCILNSFLILGIGAIIISLDFTVEFMNGLILLASSTLLIWIFCFVGKRNTITRYKAAILLIIYLGYIINLFR